MANPEMRGDVATDAALEQAVACRTAELQRANHELEAFARQLAHELRTPIGQLAGIAQLLLQRLDDGPLVDSRRWLELQLQTAQQMGETVQTLLELARGSQGTRALVEIDLSALCRTLVQELPALPRRAPVRWFIAPGMRVRGAPSLVVLLMRNLLSNAAKYTAEVDAPCVSVSARPGGQGAGLQVCITDNGAGFDEAAAGAMFQPFVRLHAAERFAGTGLGLSIARRIVEWHQGWIRAHGRVDRGACFEFQFGAGASSQPTGST
ncbi:HAMP domain-containing histidine kinase [Aquincola sp. S2]|uniref:histidine kinase n=1 Tax=Pseudaquabacterium terrae TaxID=2732868 RepID=A0ABX2EPD0_9BURK|nr:HAMP domain-containing sensor histidine kinase [Aquabacterium terrae]NRF70438.1 HAMP domain-containing histidine kinase [Aquabacterium terrae]